MTSAAACDESDSGVPRTNPPRVGDERTLLESWLDFHRDTLL